MLYGNVVDALSNTQELTVENKYLLLATTLDIFKKSSRKDLDFKRRPFSEIRPLLSDLFGQNTEHWRTAWNFVIQFTDCEPTLCFFFSPLSGC